MKTRKPGRREVGRRRRRKGKERGRGQRGKEGDRNFSHFVKENIKNSRMRRRNATGEERGKRG